MALDKKIGRMFLPMLFQAKPKLANTRVPLNRLHCMAWPNHAANTGMYKTKMNERTCQPGMLSKYNSKGKKIAATVNATPHERSSTLFRDFFSPPVGGQRNTASYSPLSTNQTRMTRRRYRDLRTRKYNTLNREYVGLDINTDPTSWAGMSRGYDAQGKGKQPPYAIVDQREDREDHKPHEFGRHISFMANLNHVRLRVQG